MSAFQVNDKIRYRPSVGTYGYEYAIQSDGRVPGIVVGFSPTRVRVRLTLYLGRITTRCVDEASLVRHAELEALEAHP